MGASWSMSQISSPTDCHSPPPINTDVDIEKNSNVPTTSQISNISPPKLARSESNKIAACDDQVPVVSKHNSLEQFQTPPMYPPSETSDQNHPSQTSQTPQELSQLIRVASEECPNLTDFQHDATQHMETEDNPTTSRNS